jgi:GntR family transcriptional repressor for pyruvate dehydrogenase complex
MSRKTPYAKPVKKTTFAEQMADSIRESILSGELEAGAALPTEPELAEQFGVSRAVVRDATRILMALGLVEVQHGRGVFVTQPYNAAFGDALLLALRRVGATAWDVEQFEQVIFPEVVSLAASSASDEEIGEIRRLADELVQTVSDFHVTWWRKIAPTAEVKRYGEAFFRVLEAIYAATHNHVFRQLARPLYHLRSLRDWAETEADSPENVVVLEKNYILGLVEAIDSRDPAKARQTTLRLMKLPKEAMEAMRQTPVGEITVIPVPPLLMSSDDMAHDRTTG